MKTVLKPFHKPRMLKLYFATFLIFFIALGFTHYQVKDTLPPGDKNNGGLYLPGGFQALVVVDSIGGGSTPLPANRQAIRPANAPPANGLPPPPVIPNAPPSNQLNRPNNAPIGNYLGARHLAVKKV